MAARGERLEALWCAVSLLTGAIKVFRTRIKARTFAKPQPGKPRRWAVRRATWGPGS